LSLTPQQKGEIDQGNDEEAEKEQHDKDDADDAEDDEENPCVSEKRKHKNFHEVKTRSKISSDSSRSSSTSSKKSILLIPLKTPTKGTLFPLC